MPVVLPPSVILNLMVRVLDTHRPIEVAFSLPKMLLKEPSVAFPRHKHIQKNRPVMLYRLRRIYGVSQRCFSRGCQMPWIQTQPR